jgi:hypothetical protein
MLCNGDHQVRFKSLDPLFRGGFEQGNPAGIIQDTPRLLPEASRHQIAEKSMICRERYKLLVYR